MKKNVASVFLSVAIVGCATTNASTPDADPSGAERVQMEPLVVRSDPDPLTGLEEYDAQVLFELGGEQFRKEAYDRAVRIYEKLLSEFPDAEVVPLARYNAGLAYERLAEWTKAAFHFAVILKHHPSSETYRDAHFRLARSYGKLEDWRGVADTFWAARQLEPSLEPMDELEARVGTGVGLFMQQDYASAEREFMRAVRFFEDHEQKDYLPADYFVGQARFYLGEILAREFEGRTLAPPKAAEEASDWVKFMGVQLEEKCQLLLRAQSSFIRTIRVGHRGWATAAGYRIGSLYEKLFEELLEVPMPPELSPDAAATYREELRERVSVLVKKAIRVYEANREMAERIGERNEWVEKTSVALERMKKLYLETAES